MYFKIFRYIFRVSVYFSRSMPRFCLSNNLIYLLSSVLAWTNGHGTRT